MMMVIVHFAFEKNKVDILSEGKDFGLSCGRYCDDQESK